MSFINEQLIIIGIGAFVSYSAKKCRIYPIPARTEIIGIVLGLGIVWLIQQYFNGLFYLSFIEQCRFILLGYLPWRIIKWPKKKK